MENFTGKMEKDTLVNKKFYLLLGFYLNDKKEGFGVYYYTGAKIRISIGFWKNGKQEGVGKYLSQNESRYGVWVGGDRQKWLKTQEEAFAVLNPFQLQYENMFKMSLKEISEFLLK